MKISVTQFNVVPMAIDRNIAEMIKLTKAAKGGGCELIVFPELCISGYVLSDQWLDRHFCDDLMAANTELLNASKGIGIVYGNVFNDSDISKRIGKDGHFPNKDGRSRLYNAAYFIQDGHYAQRSKPTNFLPNGVQPKTLLPSYRFFDDPRYFFSLQDVAIDMGVNLSDLCLPFKFKSSSKSHQIGLQVCEDLWCKDYRENYQSTNVTKHLIANEAEMIVNISASPWTLDKHDARDRRITFLKEESEAAGHDFVPYIYCNTAGAQNNGKNIITFDGGSCVYDNEAKLVQDANHPFVHDKFVHDMQAAYKPKIRQSASPIAQKNASIITGLHHLKDMLGWENTPKFLVGLSGGVDSAVVTALLVQAFGYDSVMTVNMPSQYNSQKTQEVAAHVSSALDIDYHQIVIDGLVDAHRPIFEKLDNHYPSPDWMRKLSDENIQAKVRGTSILSNIAGRYGRMFTNNGNKVEIALGYATLYGDVGGVVAPIGDLTKAEVFDMARFLNETVFKKEVIPNTLLPDALFRFAEDAIPPSAELREQQIDPMKFGYHCALLEKTTSFQKTRPEDVMQWFIEGNLAKNLGVSDALITRWGVDDPVTFIEDIEWFYEGIRKSVFKRIQSPPIILTSPSAYGFDIRESQLPMWQSDNYKRRKARVLNLRK